MTSNRKGQVKLELSIDENKLYEAVYWAIRDLFEHSLREGIRRVGHDSDITHGILLLNIVYEAIKEGVYRAVREALFSGVLDLSEKKRGAEG